MIYFEDDGSLNNIEKTFRINFLPSHCFEHCLLQDRIYQIFV